MLIIILFQLLFMVLFPCSIYFLIFKKNVRPWIPIILIVLSILVFYQFKNIWPFDFLFKSETRFGYTLGDYRVNVVQKPGFDYYDTMYEIFSIDTDDNKWWFPKIEQENSKIYFLRFGEEPGDKSNYISLIDSALFVKGSFYGIVSDLNFK